MPSLFTRPFTLLLFLLLFASVLYRTAWVSEDAYITLRTVDNFVNGYGLTWNVGERVQAYTHPLWMFMLAGIYALTRESFFTTLFLSLAASFLTVLIVGLSAPRCNWSLAVGLAALISSHSFIDYSTSGLENPLSHLLLALFLIFYLRCSLLPSPLRENGEGKGWGWGEASLAALLVLNRQDLLLLVLPALAYVGFRARSWKVIAMMLVGFAPVIAWELFSLFYYGFPFPNTAYAKLSTGIGGWELAQQGLYYYANALKWDALILPVIAVALVWTFWRGSAAERWTSSGVLLYMVYVVFIGGDFMSGRFFTAPLLVCVVLLMRRLTETRTLVKAGFFVGVVLFGLFAPTPMLLSSRHYPDFYWDEHGIADERSFYFDSSALLTRRKGQPMPAHWWAYEGQWLRRSVKGVIVRGNIGYLGYFAGPQVYIIDVLALSDALLARLPTLDLVKWRIGHFSREMPAGYLLTLRTGQNHLRDQDLAYYYERLKLIIRGPLWDGERLLTVLKMNLGLYDPYLDRYIVRYLFELDHR